MSSNRVDAVRKLFPSFQSFDADDALDASEAIAELWRYLALVLDDHQAARIEALEDLANARRIVGNLASADRRAADIFDRLTHWAGYVSARSIGTQAYGLVDPDGSPDEIASLMNRVNTRFGQAASAHRQSAEDLGRVESQLEFVFTNE